MAAELWNTAQIQNDIRELLIERWQDAFGTTSRFDATVTTHQARLSCVFVVESTEEDFRLLLEGQMNPATAKLDSFAALDRIIDTLDGFIAKFAENRTRSPISGRWTQMMVTSRINVSVRGELTRPRLEAEADRLLS